MVHPSTKSSVFHIGSIPIQTPVTLAPMAGHTNRAFRRIVRELGGCGLVCTEVMSSASLRNDSTRHISLKKFPWDAIEEFPMAVQLFGNDPVIMAEAAQVVVENGAPIVDINMGCWVPKIAKKGAGAALLRDVDTARSVVEAVVEAVDVPVTVKIRTGFEDGVVTAIPFAKAAEEAGVQAIAVHARFAGQGHSGAADWDIIRQVKNTVQEIPVIGNGDVHTIDDAVKMLSRTGCDAVMVGRGALGRPWVFRQINHFLRTGETLPDPNRSQRAAIALHHAKLTLKYNLHLPEVPAVHQMRKQLSKYALDHPGSVKISNQLVRVDTLEDIRAILEPITHENSGDDRIWQGII